MKVVRFAMLPHGSTVELCAKHEAAMQASLMQVVYGRHEGRCALCEDEEVA